MQNLSMNLLSVLDEIPLGICLISRERKIVFINRALEALERVFPPEMHGAAMLAYPSFQ